ncbi:uncharacterized protein LOC119689768 isoform X1 [Teleopsis dalmanni]|uniref:uncharacterized protein LOC119662604 n=1 Tax=Teleopsis dalmanni TaxID=139649 RepID=UPI0018CE52B0|nr:uncharacterized protein LOC119662604 [Teleopsis dalmanni]XP_037960597.1 uncharacterized protein LOC119689768 isoform X1 [Teleopsis dalmanni]
MCEKSLQFDTNRSKEDTYFDIYKPYIKTVNKRQRIVLIQNIFKAIVTTLDDCRDFNDSVIESPQSKKFKKKTVENKSYSVPIGPGARLAPRVSYTVSERVDGATTAMAIIQKSTLPIFTVHANNARAINNFSHSLLRQNAPQPPSDNNNSDDEFAGIIRTDELGLWIKDEPLDDYDL